MLSNFFEIHYSDLNEKKQRELLRLLEISSPEQMGWHIRPLAFIHLAVVYKSDIEDDEEEPVRML